MQRDSSLIQAILRDIIDYSNDNQLNMHHLKEDMLDNFNSLENQLTESVYSINERLSLLEIRLIDFIELYKKANPNNDNSSNEDLPFQ